LQRGDAVDRHRVRLQIRIGAARGEQALVGEALEGLVHALGGLSGGVEEFDAGAVGVFLLLALIGQQRALDHRLRCGDRRGAGAGEAVAAAAAAGTGGECADAEQHRDDHLGLGLRQLLAHLGEMAAGQMAGFVCQHADDLVRCLRLQQRTVVDEDATAVSNERVERAVVDDDDLDILLLQTGGAQDRPGVFAQQLLGLGVAQHRRSLLLGPRGDDGADRKCDRGQQRGQLERSGAKRGADQHRAIYRRWPAPSRQTPTVVPGGFGALRSLLFLQFFFTRTGCSLGVFTGPESVIRSHRMRPVWGGGRYGNPNSAAAVQ